MAAGMKIVVTAEDKASREIKAIQKAFKAGSISAKNAAKQIKGVNKSLKDTKLAAGEAKKGMSNFTKGIAIGNIAAMAAAKSIELVVKAVEELGKAIMVAANIEESEALLYFVGQRAGYASEELDGFVKSLKESGIASQETYTALLRATQAEISYIDAVKIGGLAQDAATIGKTNSSDAYMRIIDSVAKLMPRQLKELGIIVNLNTAYKKYSKQTGVAVSDMTEAQKKQAMLNEVFKKGEIIAGAYDVAMGFASKQLRSMPRYIQDLQIAVGQYFTPALAVLVQELTLLTKSLTTAFTGDSAEGAKMMAADIGIFVAGVVAGGKVLFNMGQIAWNVFQLSIIAPIESAAIAAAALFTALSDPFNLNAWAAAGDIMSTVLDPFKEDWTDIEGHIEDSEDAVVNLALTVARIMADLADKPPIAPRIVDPDDLKDDLAKYSTAAKAAEAIQKERNRVLKQVDDIYFEQSLIGKSDFEAEKAQIDRAFKQEAIQIAESSGLTLLEKMAALDALDINRIEAHNKLAQSMQKDKWKKFLQTALEGVQAMSGLYDTLAVIMSGKTATAKEEEEFKKRLDQDAEFAAQRHSMQLEQQAANDALRETEFATDEERRLAQNELNEIHYQEQLELQRAIAEEQFRIQQEASKKSIGVKAAEAIQFVIRTGDQIEALKKFANSLKISAGLGKSIAKVMSTMGTAFGSVTGAMWDAVSASASWIAAQIAMIAKTIAAAAVTAAKAVAGIPIIGPALAVAAAASVAIGLKNLVKGFHDPRNDAVAYQWGVDAGTNFMEGLQSVTAAPQFGEAVIGSMRGVDSLTEATPAPVTQHITINASGADAREIAEEIENLRRNTGTTLVIEEDEVLR